MLYRRLLGHQNYSVVVARNLLAYHSTTKSPRHYTTTATEQGVIRSRFPTLDIPRNKSYVEFILDCCERHGDAEAIVDDATGKVFTYNHISNYSRKCGSALVRAGLKKGDVVAMFLPNIPEYPMLMYGIQAAGGIPSTVNPRYTSDELTYQLRDCGARFIIAPPNTYKTAIDAATHANIEHVFETESLFTDVYADDGSCLTHVYTTDNPVGEVTCLPYSSGTTGVSKGVMQTHYNYIAHAMMLGNQDFMQRDKRLVVMSLLPFFHAFGLAVVIGMHFYLGSKLVVMQEFDGEILLKLLEKYKVTDFPLVPPLALFLAKHPLVDKYDLSSFESLICAAAPVGKDTLTDLKKRIPSLKIVRQGYGLTESTAAAIVNPVDPAQTKDGSIGLLLPNMEGKVTDLQTGQPVGPNQDGEICLRGPVVCKGYLNKPEQTAKTFSSDDWLHTGDIGHYDEDNYFYIVDRLKELIKYKGHQVAPAEIEALLVSHPHITDAAVIGIPEEAAGELPKAFVVAKAPITEDEVVEFVAEHVSPEKKLRGGCEIVEAIPKTASGKILRRFLKEQELLKHQKK